VTQKFDLAREMDNQGACCPHDTNGDGDCHLCYREPQGCPRNLTAPTTLENDMRSAELGHEMKGGAL
jgi:hypothetical protein